MKMADLLAEKTDQRKVALKADLKAATSVVTTVYLMVAL